MVRTRGRVRSVSRSSHGHSGTGSALGDSKSFEINVLAADVSLAKSVTPPTAFAGDSITYTLAFSNPGGAMVRDIVITDYIPISITVKSVISNSEAAIARTTVQKKEVLKTTEIVWY